jgi:hypothetical protein
VFDLVQPFPTRLVAAQRGKASKGEYADRAAGTHMQHARLTENEVRRVESWAGLRKSSGSMAIFTAIRRASSRGHA